jgi:hypothetical protein
MRPVARSAQPLLFGQHFDPTVIPAAKVRDYLETIDLKRLRPGDLASAARWHMAEAVDAIALARTAAGSHYSDIVEIAAPSRGGASDTCWGKQREPR